jgi:hypothetical protein
MACRWTAVEITKEMMTDKEAANVSRTLINQIIINNCSCKKSAGTCVFLTMKDHA